MARSQIDFPGLLLAALGASVLLTLLSGPLAWLASIGGIILLLILFSFDQEGYRTIFQSVAFSAVCGLCVALAAGTALETMGAQGEIHLSNGQWSSKWMPLTCLFAAIIVFVIDRVRMNTREPIEVRQARGPVVTPAGFIPRTVSETPAPAQAPQTVVEAPIAETRAPAPPPTPVPVSEPIQRQAVWREPIQPVPEPVVTAPPAEITRQDAVTAPLPEITRPNVTPIIPRTGKECTIYVNLVGEGLNLLRSVKAEHMGRDYYRIVEEMPEGETWEFQPGQVVKCQKKKLSTGRALVAYEEAPRAS